MKAEKGKCKEIWAELDDGQAMCALINDHVGWLMYLREEGDAGFSSRNPKYDGPPDAIIEYYLSNGQLDVYPAGWAIPLEDVERALDYFRKEKKAPAFITWHNDSEDGTTID